MSCGKKRENQIPYLFEVSYKVHNQNHILVVCGSSAEFGQWDLTKGIIARNFPPGSDRWVAAACLLPQSKTYWNWVVVDKADFRAVRWEERPQREFLSGFLPTRLKTDWNGGMEMDIHFKYKFNHIGFELTESEGAEELSSCTCILPSRAVFLALTEEVPNRRQ